VLSLIPKPETRRDQRHGLMGKRFGLIGVGMQKKLKYNLPHINLMATIKSLEFFE
jgi:hypothetical protein